jgi:hypothetical protein
VTVIVFIERFGPLFSGGFGKINDTSNPTFVLPVSYMAGLSRGGLTAQLALAKAGGTLGTLSAVQTKVTSEATAAGLTDAAQIGTLVKTEVEKVVGTGFFQPPRFSCAIDFFGPSTFLATSYRLGLEAFVKGYGNKTSFYDLPTGEQLFERWKAYGEGVKFKKSDGTLAANDAENAKDAAELIFKIFCLCIIIIPSFYLDFCINFIKKIYENSTFFFLIFLLFQKFLMIYF